MRVIEPHIHMYSRTTNDYEAMYAAGIRACVEPSFWLGTDHSVARLNLNLLVFSPLWLIAVFCRRCWRTIAILIAFASAVSLLMPFLPPRQYTWDVLAAFLPFNLVSAWIIWRYGRRSG